MQSLSLHIHSFSPKAFQATFSCVRFTRLQLMNLMVPRLHIWESYRQLDAGGASVNSDRARKSGWGEFGRLRSMEKKSFSIASERTTISAEYRLWALPGSRKKRSRREDCATADMRLLYCRLKRTSKWHSTMRPSNLMFQRCARRFFIIITSELLAVMASNMQYFSFEFKGVENLCLSAMRYSSKLIKEINFTSFFKRI